MKDILYYINCKLIAFSKKGELNELVEIVREPVLNQPGKFDYYPAKYTNNEYKKIEYGIYHRIIGRPKSVFDEDTSCGNELIIRTIPMRLVAIIDKQGANDNQYEDVRLSQRVADLIQFDHNKQLSLIIGADSVYTEIISIDNDRNEVYKREYSMENKIPYNKTLFSIDYNIIINGNKQCMDSCLSGAVNTNKDYSYDYS